jgi:hypothetical protein
MKKTTSKKSENLAKRLAKYGALSIAIAGIADANGQIVFTDVDPDFSGGNGTSYELDMDNDMVSDFGIIGSNAPAVGVYGVLPSNSWVGSIQTYRYPFALNSGAVISSAQTIWYGGVSNVGTLNYVSCYGGVGGSNWCGVNDKFLGLRFQIDGETHYGWAKLDVSLSGDSFTIKEYAYNEVAGESIVAGQTLSTEDFNQANNYVISFSDKQVTVSSIVDEANYRIISLSGQIVLEGKSNAETHVIDMSNLSSGIYIVEVTDGNNQRIQRKKIALQ